MNTANHCIREYIFVFATLYSRYESYSSLGVFVPALVYTVADDGFVSRAVGGSISAFFCRRETTETTDSDDA